MIKIDNVRVALDALDRAAHEKPKDYTYPLDECRYAEGGAPSCLVGVALSKMGVSVEALEEMDESGPSEIGVANVPGAQVSDPVRRVFQAAQRTQDNGRPWWVAVDRAREEVS